MLSGSTIARAILLLVAAAAAIGLAGAYWLRGGASPEEPALVATQPEPQATAHVQPTPEPGARAEA